MNKESSDKLRVLSYMFTLKIVGYHSNIAIENLYTSNILRIIIGNTWEMLANVAMSFFFMTSAFLLYYKATVYNIYDKLKRRISTIIVPFLIWNTIYYLLSVIQNGFRGNIWSILYRFSFDPYDGPLWYLFAITLLSSTSPLVLKFKEKEYLKYAFAIIMLLSFCIYGFHFFSAKTDLHIASWGERLFRYLPSYLLGTIFGVKGGVINIHISRKKYLIGLIITLSTFWILVGDHIPDVLKMLFLLLCPLAIWAILPRVLNIRLWMRNSFVIYAIHRLILTLVTIIEDRFNLVGGTQFIAE